MPPIRLNRRRFLGCSASAAAGLALSQGIATEAGELATVGLGLIGLGNRGTTLLRALLEIPAVHVKAVCDPDAKHRLRARGIVEKATSQRPEALDQASQLLERGDIDAVILAVPCDLHAEIGVETLRAGKHLYIEKPLAHLLADCDRLIARANAAPHLAAHVGFQRRSNPRYRDGAEIVRRGELGGLIEGSGIWVSSNGPMNGHGDWLAHRERSGDWMVEQAVHVWDVLQWVAGGPPTRAFGRGRTGLFAKSQPGRDVTDHYSVQLEWANGFHVNFLQSWVAPADDRFTGTTLQVLGVEGGLDFASGALTFRDKSRPRQVIQPGNHPDTKFALEAFLASVRTDAKIPPPVSLADARDATLTGLLVRAAVDGNRLVTMDEIRAGSG